MSDLAIGARDDTAFRPLTVALMLVIGLLGFVGALVLGAYAPTLQSNGNGGEHALSKSAVGFSGIVALAAATGRNPRIVRNERGWVGAELVVATPPRAAVPVGGLTQARLYKTTLMLLPKWDTVKDEDKAGWVWIKDLLPVSEPQGVLAPAQQFTIERRSRGGTPLVTASALPPTIRFAAPVSLQVITGATLQPLTEDSPDKDGLVPLITDGHGGTVLAQLGNLYVLADPDLLDNAGMKDSRNAASALALLDWLNRDHPSSIGFDVTLNGLGQDRNPLTLAFDPPFLAMTLAIAAVLLLLGLSALARFGAPRRRERAIAFGKAALVDNSAALVRKAGRARRLGGRYAAVIRDHAVRAFGVPPRLKGAAIDAYLDGLEGARFSDLAASAEAADDDHTLLAAARALHDWQQEKLG